MDSEAAEGKLRIIYQDDHLVAIDKPSGLLVHKSDIDKYETRFALQLLRDQLNRWVFPVHRLDKPTSGVLLFALHEETARELVAQFEARMVRKTYQAIVRGYTDLHNLVDHPIREEADFKQHKQKMRQRPAKAAITEYQRLGRLELPVSDGRFPTSRYSWIQLMPKTGRKHQLRKHMKHISHPIIGDVRYGKGLHNRLFKQIFGVERLLLVANELQFNHPFTRQPVRIATGPDETFLRILQHAGWQMDALASIPNS